MVKLEQTNGSGPLVAPNREATHSGPGLHSKTLAQTMPPTPSAAPTTVLSRKELDERLRDLADTVSLHLGEERPAQTLKGTKANEAEVLVKLLRHAPQASRLTQGNLALEKIAEDVMSDLIGLRAALPADISELAGALAKQTLYEKSAQGARLYSGAMSKLQKLIEQLP